MKSFSSAALLLLAVCATPAVAQTARIAHFSHSGSAATLAEAADNFGLPSHPTFLADSIKLISDTVAVEYGRWNGYRVTKEEAKEKTHLVRLATPATKQQLLKEYQLYRPHVKLIGFDSTAKPVESAPVLKKQKLKRKKSAAFVVPLSPPSHPGVALAIAAILVLAGAGWLLGERPVAETPAR